MRLTVYDFPTQAANIKGQRHPSILQYQVPPTVPLLGLSRFERAIIQIPLGQYFTVANAGGSAATPTLNLDYPMAPPLSQVPIGDALAAQYSTDGSTWNTATLVTSTPAADGQFQKIDDDTVKVYVPASATRYWRIYFRPVAGRLIIARQPSTESADQRIFSVFEKALATLHRQEQMTRQSPLVLGRDAVFPARSYVLFQLYMPDVSATQDSETNITKTVTQQALFVPYTTNSFPWVTKQVGIIDLAVEY